MSTFDPSLTNRSADAAKPGPVIAHLSATVTEGLGIEVLFRAPDQVDVRVDGGVWMPLELLGGDVEVRVR